MNADFDYWFKANFQAGLAICNRFDTMYIALNRLLQKPNPCIVETGVMRAADNWHDGKSTLVFGCYSKKYNGITYTVDIDANAMEICKKATCQVADYIEYTVADSVTYLKNFNGKIDLLYLDSMDCPDSDELNTPALITSQKHQYNEIEAAFNKLAAGAIVLLDDNDRMNGGKTKLSKLFLQQNGFTELISWRQSLWVRN